MVVTAGSEQEESSYEFPVRGFLLGFAIAAIEHVFPGELSADVSRDRPLVLGYLFTAHQRKKERSQELIFRV